MTRPLHSSDAPLVGVVMGSDSDWRVMSDASQVLTDFGIAHEVEVVSAHRTPDKLIRYGREARGRGLRVIIAGAGGAAHLPGMLASVTALPVIGVPVQLVDARRARLAAQHRADARRHPGRDRLDQRGEERGPARGADPRRRRTTTLAAQVEAYARDLEGQVEEKNRRLKESL